MYQLKETDAPKHVQLIRIYADKKLVWTRKPLALCVPLRRKSAKKTASNTGGHIRNRKKTASGSKPPVFLMPEIDCRALDYRGGRRGFDSRRDAKSEGGRGGRSVALRCVALRCVRLVPVPVACFCQRAFANALVRVCGAEARAQPLELCPAARRQRCTRNSSPAQGVSIFVASAPGLRRGSRG